MPAQQEVSRETAFLTRHLRGAPLCRGEKEAGASLLGNAKGNLSRTGSYQERRKDASTSEGYGGGHTFESVLFCQPNNHLQSPSFHNGKGNVRPKGWKRSELRKNSN